MSIIICPNKVSPTVLAAREELNRALEAKYIETRQWYEYASPADYRRAELDGTTGLGKPIFDSEAIDFFLPSSHGDHSILLRQFIPKGKVSKGVFLHFHGSGFCISSARLNDGYLRHLADTLSLTVVTVDYRKAPEDPFPAPLDDAIDAALFALSLDGEQKLRGPLTIIGGESAGAYLSVWVTLELRQRGIDVMSRIKGLVASYGIYDMTYLPSARNYSRRLMLNNEDVSRFIDTALPQDVYPLDVRKQPHLSPLYADLRGLPPAFFLVGSEDPLIDDSVFLATKWGMAKNETSLKIIPAAFHGFTLFPIGEMADEGIRGC
ncbi:Alpha/Beta hydrolase protein [Aspergillus caelatus]|uniref:Alpha/Beta hydrolase protein n=1 Tax=Aspergillus caelatus TaxID=61420 RepID=A0A5N6ZMB9_9EURO|nr:Alpha/Beta hydrolase protein [Aspergillus caelatus]KAE8358126.1 Alpha/Beta hydrolase protein [Aspergillus caelatus]